MTTRAYRSKIGRLPFAVRNELNERLRDGHTGPEILTWLNAHKAWRKLRASFANADISAQNLTDWRTTGYADWLLNQSRADHIRAYAETAQTIATAAGGHPAAVGSRILAAKMIDLLESADAETATDLARAISQLRKGEQDQTKLQLDAERNRLAQQQLTLARDKFRRETCELFLRWYNDQKVKAIIDDSTTDTDQKTEILGRTLFGDLWD